MDKLKKEGLFMEKFDKEQIQKLRKELKDVLLKYDGTDKIKFEIESNILESLLFETDENNKNRKYFAIDFKLIKKIDLSDVSFDSVYVYSKDFSDTYGIKINPQTVYDKNLSHTRLTDVEIIGSFDDVNLNGTNFTGSKGAKIDPQTIHRKEMINTTLKDAEIIGSLDGVDIFAADFTGSKGARIDLQKVHKLSYAKLTDTEIIGSLDNVGFWDLVGTNFRGSKGAKINKSYLDFLLERYKYTEGTHGAHLILYYSIPYIEIIDEKKSIKEKEDQVRNSIRKVLKPHN
jgi:uncharacterized protein YjbI with pentapeptide repeats